MTVFVVGLSLMFSADARAQVGMMQTGEEIGEHHESLEEVLNELTEKYDVQRITDLSCSDLTDEELIRLGDGLMEEMHPGEQHERMDQMMGGEGSESLDAMHFQMGRNYLGCDSDNPAVVWGGAMGGMMGRVWPMMMNGQWDNDVVMGNGGFFGVLKQTSPWFVLVVVAVLLAKLLLLVLVVILLVAAIRYLWVSGSEQTSRKKKK